MVFIWSYIVSIWFYIVVIWFYMDWMDWNEIYMGWVEINMVVGKVLRNIFGHFWPFFSNNLNFWHQNINELWPRNINEFDNSLYFRSCALTFELWPVFGSVGNKVMGQAGANFHMILYGFYMILYRFDMILYCFYVIL